MMEQDYRREMEQVTLSPQQKERIIQAMGREQTRRRAAPLRLLLAAALLCAALTTSALALSPTLRDHLAQLLGSFAPYSQRVEGAAAVCQEVEVRVVSAVTDQYRMKIYVEVTDRTGERFTDDSIRLSWDIPRVWDGLGIFSLPTCLAYDPERHTALFELEQTNYHRAEAQEELELTIHWIQTGYYSVRTAQALPTELLSDEYLETMTLESGDLVLVPEQTPAPLEGTDLFRLSSLGFAPDGTLQAIFQLSDRVVPWERNHLLFTASFGDEGYDSRAETKDFSFTWNGKQYLGFGQEFPLERRDQLTLGAAYGTLMTQQGLEPIEGPWTVTFPVENLPAKELELTGAVGEWEFPTTLVVSPLGALVTGSYDVGYWGGGPFAVIYDDGTRVEQTESQGGSMFQGELCVLGNWEFTQPIDLDRVAGVEVWNWYIPVTGGDAGVVRAK